MLTRIATSLRRVMNPERRYYYAEDHAGNTTVDYATQDEAYEAFIEDFGTKPAQIVKAVRRAGYPGGVDVMVVWEDDPDRSRNPGKSGESVFFVNVKDEGRRVVVDSEDGHARLGTVRATGEVVAGIKLDDGDVLLLRHDQGPWWRDMSSPSGATRFKLMWWG